MLPTLVKVHCGSSHVHGKARNYPYYVASKFFARKSKAGRVIYENKGVVCGPFRGYKKCTTLAKDYVTTHNCVFIDGYGSLHNKSPKNIKVEF
jgi:hypothetical protein